MEKIWNDLGSLDEKNRMLDEGEHMLRGHLTYVGRCPSDVNLDYIYRIRACQTGFIYGSG